LFFLFVFHNIDYFQFSNEWRSVDVFTIAIPCLKCCAKQKVSPGKTNLHLSKDFNWLQLKSN
jgi:hypothetical protein